MSGTLLIKLSQPERKRIASVPEAFAEAIKYIRHEVVGYIYSHINAGEHREIRLDDNRGLGLNFRLSISHRSLASGLLTYSSFVVHSSDVRGLIA